MAQINITLNQEKIQKLLTKDREEAFKKMFEETINAIIEAAESAEQLEAGRYERSENRNDSRNGYWI